MGTCTPFHYFSILLSGQRKLAKKRVFTQETGPCQTGGDQDGAEHPPHTHAPHPPHPCPQPPSFADTLQGQGSEGVEKRAETGPWGGEPFIRELSECTQGVLS